MRSVTAHTGAPEHPRQRTPERLALVVFAVIVACQGLWLFLGPGRAQWVTEDEWRQIARAWTVEGMLADHNGHLSLVPIVIYKSMFAAIGFSPFWPYRALAVAVTMAIAFCIRAVMIRSGVMPWVATVCAAPLLFVQGGQIMIGQFQMTIALLLGLLAVLAALGSCRSWRLVAGALCAVAALASSGIAIPVVIAAAVIAWRRHGLATAAILCMPGLTAFACWWLAYSPQVPDAPRQPLLSWLMTALWQYPMALAGARWSAVALIVLLAGGVWAARNSPAPDLLAPVALALAAVLMLTLTWLGRGLFPAEGPFFGRFLFLGCAMLLPLVAWAGHRLHQVSAPLIAALAALLLVGAWTNVAGWQQWGGSLAQLSAAHKLSMASLIRSPAGADVPDWVQPDAMGGIGSGTGEAPWAVLRQFTPEQIGVQDQVVPVEYANRALLQLRLAATGHPAAGRCAVHNKPVTLSLRTGERFSFVGAPAIIGNSAVTATLMSNGEPQPLSATFTSPEDGREVEVVGRPGDNLQVQFASKVPDTGFTLCR